MKKLYNKLDKNTIVATIMSNLGLKIYSKDNNIQFIDTKVGDRYVLEEMLKNGYNLGGEQSGHVILLDYNPLAALISFFRDALIYQKVPNLLLLSIWIILGVVLSLVGIRTIYKYENTYVKVMR